ncbi:hypothetical protein BV25DRAFT_1787318, partial [Artomyces pyxidatus]
DVLLYILSFLPLRDLESAAAVDKRWRILVKGMVRREVTSTVSRYLPHPLDFRALMRTTHCVLSGSVVLNCVLRGSGLTNWRPDDLDVCCPIAMAPRVMKHLTTIQGYHCAHINSPFHDPLLEPGYDAGIASLVILERNNGKQLNLIVSIDNTATTPLTHTWGTLVNNFLTADAICIAYPRMTLDGIACINPHRPDLPRHVHSANKYRVRGFSVENFNNNDVVHSPLRKSHFCPHEWRTHFDAGCFTFRFGNVGDINLNDPVVPPPFGHSSWRYGGDLCGGGC